MMLRPGTKESGDEQPQGSASTSIDMSKKTVTEVLGEIVWLMSQDKIERHRPISDLERQVTPAILTRQFRIFYMPQKMGPDGQPRLAKPESESESGKPVSETKGDPSLPLRPIGAVLCAMVSDKMAKMIEADAKTLEALPPEQWRSGSRRVVARVIAPDGGSAAMVREITITKIRDKL